MNRDEFLSQKWIPYPLLPKGVSFVGRLQEIQRQNQQWSVTLHREGKNQQAHFVKLFLSEAPELSVDLILQPGDLLAISSLGAVTLLAASKQSLPLIPLRYETLQLWQEYIYWLREFFRERGFLELQTPTLVPCPGTEPSLDVFSTDFVQGSRREKLYLPTSPELHLKKALSLGAEKIFEIKNVFRNGEITAHHQPEFMMIEWYRAYDNLQSIQHDVAELVNHLASKIPDFKKPTAMDSFTIKQLFLRHCDFDLQPETSAEQLKSLAEKIKVDVRSATSIDDFFFLIFMEKIETQFQSERLTFVEKYPPYQAALARLTEEGWGDRFEVYWQGLEIANAFHELNNPEVQRQRFAEDLKKKKDLNKPAVPLDAEFLQCLEAGMPPAAGIALGVERLFMALTGIKNISELRLFAMK